MSNFKRYLTAILLWGAAFGTALAQGHGDVSFRYEGDKIVVDEGEEPGVFEAHLDTTGVFQQYASSPGFESEVDGGGGLFPGDIVVYHVLENLKFWQEGEFAAVPQGMQLRLENGLPSVPDTVVTATSGMQTGSAASPLRNAIGQADEEGDLHAHLDFFLEPNPFPESLNPDTHGAYGLKLSLGTSRDGIENSDPFWIVFNFGLGESDFAGALAAFGQTLIPPLVGDYNSDGTVDAADYLVWRNSVGSTTDLAANGDDTGDSQGVIDGADYLVWKAARYEAGGNVVLSAQAVPEPGAVGLAVLGLLVWQCGRMLAGGQAPPS